MTHDNRAEDKHLGEPITSVRFSPLKQQFSQVDSIFEELKELVKSGDYSLYNSDAADNPERVQHG